MEEQRNGTNNYDLLSNRDDLAREIFRRINRHIMAQLDRGMVWRNLVSERAGEMEYVLDRLAAVTGTDHSTGSGSHDISQQGFDHHLISGVWFRCISETDTNQNHWQLESIWDSVDINDINVAEGCEWRPLNSNAERDVRITTEENISIWWRIVKDWSRADGKILSVQALWSGNFSCSELLLQLLEDVNTANSIQMFCQHFNLHLDMREQYMARHETNPVAATYSAVDSSLTLVISHADGDGLFCAICHENISIGQTAKQLPCDHLFHYGCTIEWFLRHLSCPLCRFDFQ